MTHRTFVQFMAVVAVLTVALALWPRSKSPSPELARTSSTSTALTENSGSLESPASVSLSADPFRRRPRGQPRRAVPAPGEARVDAAQVLAMVNQTPLQLRHLMPVKPDETNKALTPEEYRSRLQRAIEMELTLQASRVQGVELTPAQKQRLEQIAPQHQADLEHYKQYGLTWSSISAEQVEFEQRLLSAQMLEQNLVAKKADVAPSPDPEEQARYEQARRELLDQLQASASVTRTVLAP